jgi:hypothetical protein
MLARMWEKGTLIHCRWECKLMQPLWKAVLRVLKKLKIDLPHDPATQFLSIYLKKYAPGSDRATCTPIFLAALLTTSKPRKQSRCPTTDEWIKKTWFIYTAEYYSATKRNKIMLFETNRWNWCRKTKTTCFLSCVENTSRKTNVNTNTNMIIYIHTHIHAHIYINICAFEYLHS